MSPPLPQTARHDGEPRAPWRLFVALALTTGSLVALQVVLTRMFSVTIWHHFTYLVIGVALLGGGAAATLLSMWNPPARRLAENLTHCAIALTLAVLVTLTVVATFPIDPLRRASLALSLLGLVVYFAALFGMYFAGGLVVASAFRVWHGDAHRLYFADLLGAGMGALLAVPTLERVGAPAAMVVAAILTASAAALLVPLWTPNRRSAHLTLAALQIVLLGWILVGSPIQLPVPASKDLGWAQRQFGFRPEFTRWNAVGRVDVLPEIQASEPMIVGGVSAVYKATEEFGRAVPIALKMVTLDGTSMTGMYRFSGSEADLQRFRFLDHAVISAPFHVGLAEPSTLQIGVGGGIDLLLARLHSAREMTAIELNADVVRLLRDRYADYTGRLAEHPRTEIVVAEGRSFLTRSVRQYDVIQGIGLDNVAALTGGAYVLSESYLYTVESIDLALQRLTPRGVFAWTRNSDQPPREMLRLVGLAAEALRRRGVSNVAAHIAVVTNDRASQATMLVRATPFDDRALADLRPWVAANGFSFLHDPKTAQPTIYAEYLNAASPRAFEQAYQFNIHPVTDDAPFFYNYFRWHRLFSDRAVRGDVLSLPIGNMILAVMFASALVTAAVAIVLPLRRWRRDRRAVSVAPWQVLTYFAALGMGYTFVEIVLVQRFTLFIGYPTSAIAATIFGLLVSSAAGSLLAGRFIRSAPHLVVAAAAVSALLVAYTIWLPAVIGALQALPDGARVAITVAVISPLGAAMGMPFPTGLRALGAAAPDLIPWAWGMNGVFSVVGSTLVIIVGMTTSFTAALGCAVICYAVAGTVATALWRLGGAPRAGTT